MTDQHPITATDTDRGPAEQLRDRIAPQLVAAMRAKDRQRVGVLREVLAALGNAEAVPPAASPVPGPAASEHVAAAVGLGAGEARRAELSTIEVAAVVASEADQRDAAAATYDAHGDTERAGALRAEAHLIRTLLG